MVRNNHNQTRQDRAEQIRVQEVRRMRDGVFDVDFVNEDGDERSHTLIPREIWSSSPDMRFRGDEGRVGKYLRALAMHDEDAREQLDEGVRNRAQSINDELTEIRNRESNLRRERNRLLEGTTANIRRERE